MILALAPSADQFEGSLKRVYWLRLTYEAIETKMSLEQRHDLTSNNIHAYIEKEASSFAPHQVCVADSPVVQTEASREAPSGSDTFSFLEFFAGAGLVRLGLEPLWSCIWANDIDARKQEVYEEWFGPGELVLGDVGTVTIDSLPMGADMAWASFPCQDLSLAGWRRGMKAERSGTFWEFWRLMHDSMQRGDRPPLIVIENVVGMLYGKDFAMLCEALATLGMQFGPLVVDARLFLPQSRPRVFLIAVDARVDCSPFTLEEVPGAVPWFPKAVRSAYDQMPASIREFWRWWTLPEPTLSIPPVEDMIEENPDGVAWHEPSETKRLMDMMTELNLEKTKLAMEQGPSVGFIYKRIREKVQRAEVRFDGVAGCLRTPEGGSSRQIVLSLYNGQIKSRLLSPREAARLMGVPDPFWLPHKYNDAYRAIGDGVAVPVVRWLSEQLLIHLARSCRESEIDAIGGHHGIVGQELLSSKESIEALVTNRAAVTA